MASKKKAAANPITPKKAAKTSTKKKSPGVATKKKKRQSKPDPQPPSPPIVWKEFGRIKFDDYSSPIPYPPTPHGFIRLVPMGQHLLPPQKEFQAGVGFDCGGWRLDSAFEVRIDRQYFSSAPLNFFRYTVFRDGKDVTKAFLKLQAKKISEEHKPKKKASKAKR